MSVTSYAVDALFVVRTIKYLSTNPDNKWANSYEFRSVAGGSEDELLTLAGVVIDFEKNLARSTVLFDRVLISTWGEDSKPYNPETFISSTVTAAGVVVASGSDLGLNTCFSVTRQAASGRFGHIFYRGYLAEADVEAPAGKTVLTDRAAQQTALNSALASSGLDDYIGTSPAGAFGMVLVSKTGTQIRPVTALRAQGVSTVPQDHKWFNRTSPA